MIRLLSWDSYGNLSLIIRGKEYNYTSVSPYLYDKIKMLLSHKNYKAVFSILRSL